MNHFIGCVSLMHIYFNFYGITFPSKINPRTVSSSHGNSFQNAYLHVHIPFMEIYDSSQGELTCLYFIWNLLSSC